MSCSINNKLQQPEAASGVLDYAMKHFSELVSASLLFYLTPHKPHPSAFAFHTVICLDSRKAWFIFLFQTGTFYTPYGGFYCLWPVACVHSWWRSFESHKPPPRNTWFFACSMWENSVLSGKWHETELLTFWSNWQLVYYSIAHLLCGKRHQEVCSAFFLLLWMMPCLILKLKLMFFNYSCNNYVTCTFVYNFVGMWRIVFPLTVFLLI